MPDVHLSRYDRFEVKGSLIDIEGARFCC